MTKATYGRKSSFGIRVSDGREARQEVLGMAAGEGNLKAHILNRRREAERMNFSSKKDLRSQIPSGILPEASHHLPNLPLTAPPTGDQIFTYPRLWKTFFTQTATAGF